MDSTEKFEKEREEMSNEKLIELADKQVSELARTGGKSHRMTVPPRIDDTDMLFSELIRRFKNRIEQPSAPVSGEEFIDRLYSLSFEFEDSDGIKHSPWVTRDDAVQLFREFASQSQSKPGPGKSVEEILDEVCDKYGTNFQNSNLYQSLIEAMHEYANQNQKMPTDDEINLAVIENMSHTEGFMICSQAYFRKGAKWMRDKMTSK